MYSSYNIYKWKDAIFFLVFKAITVIICTGKLDKQFEMSFSYKVKILW